MAENIDKIDQLIDKIEFLKKKHELFSQEINELYEEIVRIKKSSSQEVNKDATNQAPTTKTQVTPLVTEPKPVDVTLPDPPKFTPPKPNIPLKSNVEKFIGENLINKIGIAITVIGVGIGAKYSIEHQLISPLARIILGYIMGLLLLGVGLKLKKNYENYSAVLVSGAIAIMYFMTFSAYSFYNLFPQSIAFAIMVILTVFTVVTAIKYNMQVIAHIGLVGAYAIPFLLSDGSGKVVVLFSYMAIINIGILFIAIKKYWKPLYYSSFILTWLIFMAWFATKFISSEHSIIALLFLSIFFVTFYLIFISYKLIRKEKFNIGDILLLLINSTIFYGYGYFILSSHSLGAQLLGFFTLGNALIHALVSLLFYFKKLTDRNLFYFVAGLVLVFLTIAIPVQFDGNWVTVMWAFEAALLFWIGRSKKVSAYELLSYPLIILAFFSIIQDWLTLYSHSSLESSTTDLPLLNIRFLNSILCITAFVIINFFNRHKKYLTETSSLKVMQSIMNYVIPIITLTVIYFAIRMEISTYWYQQYIDSKTLVFTNNQTISNTEYNSNFLFFKSIWVLNYSILFISIMLFTNLKKVNNKIFGYITMGLAMFMVFIFLTQGLYVFSELRDKFIHQSVDNYNTINLLHTGLRYLSFSLLGVMLSLIYSHFKQEFFQPVHSAIVALFDFLVYFSLLWIASSELISWLDTFEYSQSYKLGLSILWGIYALMLIMIGIWKKKKYLRIEAIVLFGLTLIKLFVYDISYLDTISKTIVFVSLGILLLIISFLYNKYKNLIS